MKETAKRLFALMLALTMVCGLLPVSALATEVGSKKEETIVQSEYRSYINPLYKDAVTEADLNTSSGIMLRSGTASASAATSPEKAGAALREAMVNRQASLDIAYHVDTYDKTAVWDLLEEIIEQALAHTGNPKEGDYLSFQYGGFMYGYSTTIYSDGSADITLQYDMAYYTTASQEAEMDTAVERLLTELNPTGTDYEKLKTVYDYICENIVYDYDNLENTAYTLQYTAYAALINGTSVCQGYANLLYRLALEMGIDCRIITGTGNGGGHAWNIVKLGNQYYNVDATWDATWMQEVGHYKYFLVDEAVFTADGTDHIRDTEYETDAFRSAYPTSSEAYDPTADNGETEVTYVASGTCGDNLTWKLDSEGTLTISGTGAMDDYPGGPAEQPWGDYGSQIIKVVVEPGVTTIGSGAFYWCVNMLTADIPDSVTSIGDHAFAYCWTLGNITIPDSVTSIGDGAFQFCSYLDSIVIPDSVTSINAHTFNSCDNLTSIVIPDSVTSIGESAFSWCRSLTSIVIPDGVTSIGGETFADCSSLTSITIPDSVTSIGERAFLRCESLTSIAIPASVTSIGAGVFAGCMSLTEIRVDGNNPYYCNDECGVLYNKDQTILIQAPGSMSGTYVIPDGVTFIGEIVFEDCSSLTSIVIPDSVTSIGYGAFYGCSSLTSITISDGVTSIGDWTFCYCSSLTSITIPDGVTSIGEGAFAYTGLMQIYFEGNAPKMDVVKYYIDGYGGGSFKEVAATAYYPASNDTWTEEVLTANYGGDITWVPYTPSEEVAGDLNGDDVVDDSDVAQLLWYTLFGDEYAISGNADFTGNGTVDDADVAYLLWFTLFPDDYPLQ